MYYNTRFSSFLCKIIISKETKNTAAKTFVMASLRDFKRIGTNLSKQSLTRRALTIMNQENIPSRQDCLQDSAEVLFIQYTWSTKLFKAVDSLKLNFTFLLFCSRFENSKYLLNIGFDRLFANNTNQGLKLWNETDVFVNCPMFEFCANDSNVLSIFPIHMTEADSVE